MRLPNNKGFTLIEVLIVIAIFAIGAAIAIPSIMDMGRRDQVKAEARQLKDQLAKARVAALELNTPMVVVFDKIVAGVSNGYQIVQDANGDCEADAGESATRITLSKSSITTNDFSQNDAGNPMVQWDARGYPKRKDGTLASGTVSIDGAGTQYNVVLSLAGNISITKP